MKNHHFGEDFGNFFPTSDKEIQDKTKLTRWRRKRKSKKNNKDEWMDCYPLVEMFFALSRV